MCDVNGQGIGRKCWLNTHFIYCHGKCLLKSSDYDRSHQGKRKMAALNWRMTWNWTRRIWNWNVYIVHTICPEFRVIWRTNDAAKSYSDIRCNCPMIAAKESSECRACNENVNAMGNVVCGWLLARTNDDCQCHCYAHRKHDCAVLSCDDEMMVSIDRNSPNLIAHRWMRSNQTQWPHWRLFIFDRNARCELLNACIYRSKHWTEWSKEGAELN